MWYRIKHTYQEETESGKTINFLNYYLTDADNFAEAGYKVMELNQGEGEVEDVVLLKNYKPSVNEYYENAKIFIVKVAEDFEDNGKVKTLKYPMPVFADNNDQLQHIMKDFFTQGMNNMRLTTVSETKWIYIK